MAAPAEYFIGTTVGGGEGDHGGLGLAQIRNRFRYLGTSLAICGLVSVFNAQIASTVEAEKSYHLEDYVNTHWLTSMFLFAGMSSWLYGRYTSNAIFLHLTTALNLVALPVSVLSFVADALNLAIVTDAAHESRRRFTSLHLRPHQLIAMMIYNSFDLLGCLIAFGLALAILYNITKLSSPHFVEEPQFRSKSMVTLSFALSSLGCFKIALWLKEVIWIRQMGSDNRLLFLHYTLDEPVWMAVHVLVGVLSLYCSFKGNRILLYTSFSLALVSLQPILMYLWLDYRWFCQVRITELTVDMPKQDHILGLNMFIGFMQLALTGVLIGRQLTLIRRVHKTPANLEFRLVADATLKKAVSICTVIFFAVGALLLLSDLINLYNRTFYRVFYPTEQKLPLLLFALGTVTSCVLREQFTLYGIPVAVLLLLVVAHTCVFHVAAYLYLAYNQYFRSDICEMFFYSQNTCADKLERLGTVSHFVEALLAVGVALVTVYLLAVLMRISRLHRIHLGSMTITEMRLKQRAERALLYLGVLILTLGLGIVLLSVNQGGWLSPGEDRIVHPLIVIHSVIYRSCVALSLVIYPAIQIYYSFNVVFHPLRILTLMAISIYRFAEVITQLDYRNVGDGGGIAWSLFSVVDFMAMCTSFATLCICSALLHGIYNRRDTQEGGTTLTDDRVHTNGGVEGQRMDMYGGEGEREDSMQFVLSQDN